MMCFARFLLIFSMALASAPANGEQEPACLKIFGRPTVEGNGTCTMGCSVESIKKLERQQASRRTITYWCKQNITAISPKYRPRLRDHPVSYIGTFQGKSENGTLHPTARFPEDARNAALEILSKTPPLTTPPTDEPYRRGLLIRFTSLKMTVALAPKKF